MASQPAAPEVSENLLRVWEYLFERQATESEWVSAHEVIEATSAPGTTVRWNLRRLVDLGLVEVRVVHPAHRYRVSPNARGHPYLERLREAREVFGGKHD